jgi:hypothetical protein
MKKLWALPFLPLVLSVRLMVFSSVVFLSPSLAHSQQPAAPADLCSKVTSVGGDNEVTYNLRSFCAAVGNASKGQPYSVQVAQQILSDPVVRRSLSSLRPSKQEGLKRAYAVEQLRNSAAANAVSRLNTAVSAATQNRPDAQTTAAETVNATTALVQKTGGPGLLSFALEAGALTQSSAANTSTVSGNLEGALYTLVGMDPVCFEQCGLMRDVLGDITASATFTLSQSSTNSTSSTAPATSSAPPAGTTVTVPSSVGKLTGFTAKFRILNKFDPHSTTFRNNWNAAVKKDTAYITLANSLMQSSGTISIAIFKAEDPGLDAEGQVLVSDVLTHPENLAGDYDSYATQTYANAKLGDQDLATYLQNYSELAAEWRNIRAQGIGTLATIQYSFGRPMNQPETHTITGILSYAPHNSTANGLFTANFGVSIYGSLPTAAKYGHLQYGQASLEFDRILFSPSSTGPINLNLAGYWQYQPNPSVLNITQANVAPGTTITAPTQVLVGTAGSLWVAQAQLQYKSKSGLSIPFGVKWSNKTQLLTGNKVGAQIGISYDFSFLSNVLNPLSK